MAVCCGLTLPAAADQGLTLEMGETIALKAEDVPLGQVLVELSAAVPFTLVERGETLEQPVSFDFEAADWAEAIDLLLRSEGYALTTDSASGRPTMLVVDWDVVGEALLAANGNDPDGDLTDALEEAQAAYDGALGNLGNHDGERAVAALVPALDEDGESSRLSALEALRWQSRTARNAEAVNRVAEAVETEPDPALQRAALEVLVRYGDPDEVLKALEPLALAEGPNQDLAVREWLRIREEQEARASRAKEGGAVPPNPPGSRSRPRTASSPAGAATSRRTTTGTARSFTAG